jgi:hypothetical protein
MSEGNKCCLEDELENLDLKTSLFQPAENDREWYGSFKKMDNIIDRFRNNEYFRASELMNILGLKVLKYSSNLNSKVTLTLKRALSIVIRYYLITWKTGYYTRTRRRNKLSLVEFQSSLRRNKSSPWLTPGSVCPLFLLC